MSPVNFLKAMTMKNSIFKVLGALAFALVIIGFGAYVFHLDQKVDHIYRPARLFSPSHIESSNLSKSAFPDTMSHDLNKFCYIFCQQSLYWVGKGEHTYVFETKDRSHVVKFLPLRTRAKQLRQMALSSQLAFDSLRDETGLLYLHFNRTTKIARGIVLNDFYGQQHRITGDNARFIVQKKATPFIPAMTALIREGKIEEAKRRLDQVFELLQSVAEKKISDGVDVYNLTDVIGFTPERAIYIDTWSFFKAPFIDLNSRMKYEFFVRLSPLKKWLDIASPQLAEYFRSKREIYTKTS
jgi:hypothetical protein